MTADPHKNQAARSSRPLRHVLFVCLGNSCRSQMAEGFARFYGKGLLEVASAGLIPSGQVSPETVEVMSEEGIDLSSHDSKPLTRETIEWADLVVSLGGDPGLRYPDLLEGKLVAWPISDPFGQSLSRYRRVRDEIKKKVIDLVISISDPARGKT